ncbi:hypothetical protein [Moorena producens]|uniref:hypothetical protein n=1 Tax=Moorena producens TaxID=1155739 RepID=UPI003C758511
MGKGEFAQALYEELLGEYSAAIATYKGSGKKFFQALAFQLDIPTENEEGKPIIIAALMSFGIIRFIGMGTGNKSLYIFGGVSLVAGMTLKQLGSIRGARKRLGQ